MVLSEGKPSDNDNYEGRHGVEDTRQAVLDAILQDIAVLPDHDRQASTYLPRILAQPAMRRYRDLTCCLPTRLDEASGAGIVGQDMPFVFGRADVAVIRRVRLG